MKGSLNVHADILKLCKTKEKRERVKWFHARQVFFDGLASSFIDGLALARQSEHGDARFLVTLFPDGAPATRGEAAAVFLAHRDEARCLCWAAQCGAEPRGELLRRSAEGGYAWGQKLYCQSLEGTQWVMWQTMAVAQGERDAMSALGFHLWHQKVKVRDTIRATLLWREAAELGDPWGQFWFAGLCCAKGSLEQLVWWRRSVMQTVTHNLVGLIPLLKSAKKQVKQYDSGGSGWNVFELGMGLAIVEAWRGHSRDREITAAGERAVMLYQQWCAEAKRAVLCWIWVARKAKVMKDIRLVIADFVWAERAAWSERRAPRTAESAS